MLVLCCVGMIIPGTDVMSDKGFRPAYPAPISFLCGLLGKGKLNSVDAGEVASKAFRLEKEGDCEAWTTLSIRGCRGSDGLLEREPWRGS